MNTCGCTPSVLASTLSRRAFVAESIALGALVLAGLHVPSSARAAPISNVYGTVSAGTGLNLRTGHDTTYAIIRTLPHGTRLSILETWGDWFRVSALGTAGWVASWYVTLVGTPSRTICRCDT